MQHIEPSGDLEDVVDELSDVNAEHNERSGNLKKIHRSLVRTLKNKLKERRSEELADIREQQERLQQRREEIIGDYIDDLADYGRNVMLGNEDNDTDLEEAADQLKRVKSRHRINDTDTEILDGPSDVPQTVRNHARPGRRSWQRNRKPSAEIRPGSRGESHRTHQRRFLRNTSLRRRHFQMSEVRDLSRNLRSAIQSIDDLPTSRIHHGFLRDGYACLRLHATMETVGAGDEELSSTYQAYRDLMIAGAWAAWLDDEGNYYILQAPDEVHVNDNNVVHREDGPALVWPNGDAYYFWNGVQVPEQVVMQPEEITTEDIQQEANTEQRRIMMQQYGVEDFFDEVDAWVRDEDTDQAGNDRQLLIWGHDFDPDRLDEQVDRRAWVDAQERYIRRNADACVVKVTCPSTDRTFTLQVPPRIQTCSEAVAWTFGLDEDEYAPAVET